MDFRRLMRALDLLVQGGRTPYRPSVGSIMGAVRESQAHATIPERRHLEAPRAPRGDGSQGRAILERLTVARVRSACDSGDATRTEGTP